MKKEAITHGVLEDLANRNDNWNKLDGVINQVNELEESRLILKNEIVNGDFSDGTTGWNIYKNNDYVLSEGIKLTKTVETGNIGVFKIVPSTNAEDKFYVFSDFSTSISGPVYSVPGNVNLKNGGGIVSFSEVNEHLYIVSYGASVGFELHIKNIQLLNLTQTFGAGNEPTKEEMDIIMDTIGYFNGTHTITSKEQFNILLRMVRENTLATTSLGGGF